MNNPLISFHFTHILILPQSSSFILIRNSNIILYSEQEIQILSVMIQFFLIFNKLGQIRFAQYFTFQTAKERATLQGEVTRMYMGRRDDQVFFCILFQSSSVMFSNTEHIDVFIK